MFGNGDPLGWVVLEGFSVEVTSELRPRWREAIHVKIWEQSIPGCGNGKFKELCGNQLLTFKNQKNLFPNHGLFSSPLTWLVLIQMSDLSLNLTSSWRFPWPPNTLPIQSHPYPILILCESGLIIYLPIGAAILALNRCCVILFNDYLNGSEKPRNTEEAGYKSSQTTVLLWSKVSHSWNLPAFAWGDGPHPTVCATSSHTFPSS